MRSATTPLFCTRCRLSSLSHLHSQYEGTLSCAERVSATFLAVTFSQQWLAWSAPRQRDGVSSCLLCRCQQSKVLSRIRPCASRRMLGATRQRQNPPPRMAPWPYSNDHTLSDYYERKYARSYSWLMAPRSPPMTCRASEAGKAIALLLDMRQ